MTSLVIRGMHGLGDNLHQRALVRQLLPRHRVVWLESSWVAPYHDLISQGLRVIKRPTKLRTQSKNAARESEHFDKRRPPAGIRSARVWYRGSEVQRHGSVLAAMCHNVGVDYATADFSLPVPDEWRVRAGEVLTMAGYDGRKPIMIYRPLVERTEWGGCAARNPDFQAYRVLFESIRADYFVISIADLEEGREWLVGPSIQADAEFHRGELPFETLAGLTSLASLTFASPGFAVILSQAVRTPAVCIFGGYEPPITFDGGARHAPYLAIAPDNPCGCWRHDHDCDKRIDIPSAIGRLRVFARRHP